MGKNLPALGVFTSIHLKHDMLTEISLGHGYLMYDFTSLNHLITVSLSRHGYFYFIKSLNYRKFNWFVENIG